MRFYFKSMSFILLLLMPLHIVAAQKSGAEDHDRTFNVKIEQKALKKLLYTKVVVAEQLAQSHRVIAAVSKQNAKNISLNTIKQKDKHWTNADASIKPLIESVSTNEIAQHFKQLVNFENHLYSEIFLTDNQGATIAAYPPTTDYWQGDEDKWLNSFNKGDGKIFIGDFEFDESSESNAIQISTPVWNDGKVIGVLIVGIKLTHFQAQYLKRTWGLQPSEFK